MAKTTGNPFLDNDFTELFDPRRYAERMQIPGVDLTSMMEMQRRNLDAIAQYNRVAFEGMQAVAQRQAEVMREAMEEAMRATQDIASSGAPEERAARQAEVMKHAFEGAVKNMRELAEMSAKSQSEAADLVNKRISESLDELRSAIQAVAKAHQNNAAAGRKTK